MSSFHFDAKSKTSRGALDEKVTQALRKYDGEILTLSGKCRGVDQFCKLKLECNGPCAVLEKIVREGLKVHYNKLYGFGGQIYVVTLSLGYSKQDQVLIEKLNAMTGNDVTFEVALQSYSGVKFGQGMTLILTDIK